VSSAAIDSPQNNQIPSALNHKWGILTAREVFRLQTHLKSHSSYYWNLWDLSSARSIFTETKCKALTPNTLCLAAVLVADSQERHISSTFFLSMVVRRDLYIPPRYLFQPSLTQ
jgi:hypothetical protein